MGLVPKPSAKMPASQREEWLAKTSPAGTFKCSGKQADKHSQIQEKRAKLFASAHVLRKEHYIFGYGALFL